MITSNEQIIEVLKSFSENYRDAAKLSAIFRISEYGKSRNIGIFLDFHEKYCEKTAELLDEIVNAVNNGTVDTLICKRYSELMKSARPEYRYLEDTYKRLNDHDIKEFYDFEAVISKMEELATTIDNYDYFLEDLESMAEVNSKRMNFVKINGSNNQVIGNANNSTVTYNNIDSNQLKECEDAMNEIMALNHLINEQFGVKADEIFLLLNDVSNSIEKKESSSKVIDLLKKVGGFIESAGAGVVGNIITSILMRYGIIPPSV